MDLDKNMYIHKESNNTRFKLCKQRRYAVFLTKKLLLLLSFLVDREMMLLHESVHPDWSAVLPDLTLTLLLFLSLKKIFWLKVFSLLSYLFSATLSTLHYH